MSVIESGIRYVLDNLPTFLVLWVIASAVMLALYGLLNLAADRRRSSRRIADRLRAMRMVAQPPTVERYPGCWMCEAAEGLSVQALCRHQREVHGVIRWQAR